MNIWLTIFKSKNLNINAILYFCFNNIFLCKILIKSSSVYNSLKFMSPNLQSRKSIQSVAESRNGH